MPERRKLLRAKARFAAKGRKRKEIGTTKRALFEGTSYANTLSKAVLGRMFDENAIIFSRREKILLTKSSGAG